jgi:cysteinyl-tRNA synthetase
MFDSLQKVIALIKKTGDKVVVYDREDPSASYVVMDLDQYADLVDKNCLKSAKIIERQEGKAQDLTDDDLTDRINRDICAWKNEENGQYLDEESKNRNPWAIPVKIKNGAQKVE